MKIHSLCIKNFRGIEQLTWQPATSLTCLVGPGDSTKTTILEAIGLALTTRLSVGLSDADFYKCQVENPIIIEVVLTGLTDDLIGLDSLGGYICGVSPTGEVKTDPEEGDAKALAVRFTADKSLEPIWQVFKPGTDGLEPKHLSVTMRAAFGVFRVDERFDTHLRWGRGSALAAITSGASGSASTTVQAQRAARQAVFGSDERSLKDVANMVKAASNTFGANHFDNLRVGLDPQAVNTGWSLVLHDGDVPLTSNGLGSRRLTSLGIQEARNVAKVIVIDEVETGLEPHRLHHLLRLLKKRADDHGAQVIMTTHSPLVVEDLGSKGLAIVRRTDGEVTVQPVPEVLGDLDNSAMQRMIRSGPSAMLASRVIVVEGETEMGLFRALCEHWDESRVAKDQESLAVVGTAVRNGQGDERTLKRAECLAKLDFSVAAVLDSDNTLAEEEAAAAGAGAIVIRWDDGKAIEGRIVADLPDAKLVRFVEAAIGDDPTGAARAAILVSVGARLPGNPTLTSTNPTDWVSETINIDSVRQALATTAHNKSWFKDEQRGIALGALLIELWADIKDNPLGQKLTQVYNFAYDVQEEAEGADNDA